MCPISAFTCRVWIKPGGTPPFLLLGIACVMAATWTMHLRNVIQKRYNLTDLLSARTVKVSLNSPKISYHPHTHPRLGLPSGLLHEALHPKIVYALLLAHTASTRYRMLLLLMLSKGEPVLTASWLPAWLGRLTDAFMVTTEGRWPAMLQQQHLTVERDVTLQTLEKWNVSLHSQDWNATFKRTSRHSVRTASVTHCDQQVINNGDWTTGYNYRT